MRFEGCVSPWHDMRRDPNLSRWPFECFLLSSPIPLESESGCARERLLPLSHRRYLTCKSMGAQGRSYLFSSPPRGPSLAAAGETPTDCKYAIEYEKSFHTDLTRWRPN
jgi:hypothetical protein